MQKPLPGPNVMLPALRLSDPPDLDHHLAFKRREAIWKQIVSNEHKKWCLCGSYLNHFLPSTEPLKNQTCGDEEELGVEKEDGENGAIGKEEIITEEDFIEGLGDEQ